MSDRRSRECQPVIRGVAALFYLCGHFHRTGDHDPFASALDEIHKWRHIGMSAAVSLDSNRLARVALRTESMRVEFLAPSTAVSRKRSAILFGIRRLPARATFSRGCPSSWTLFVRGSAVRRSRPVRHCDTRENDAIERRAQRDARRISPPDAPASRPACRDMLRAVKEVSYELPSADRCLVSQPDGQGEQGPPLLAHTRVSSGGGRAVALPRRPRPAVGGRRPQ